MFQNIARYRAKVLFRALPLCILHLTFLMKFFTKSVLNAVVLFYYKIILNNNLILTNQLC